ncbi:hypothetical protein KJ562_00725 [Patescibacteria group bacterium]|nr:hypothetical protein [Patescibacteria group bacterium]
MYNKGVKSGNNGDSQGRALGSGGYGGGTGGYVVAKGLTAGYVGEKDEGRAETAVFRGDHSGRGDVSF